MKDPFRFLPVFPVGRERVVLETEKKKKKKKPTDKRGVYWKIPSHLLRRMPWPRDLPANKKDELMHASAGEIQYPRLGNSRGFEGVHMTNMTDTKMALVGGEVDSSESRGV